MTILRSPHGCPWDRKQTHESLRPYLLEETYETLDAIDRGDFDALSGELGDVLFQVVFHAEVASSEGRFDIVDVLDAVTTKLVRRHPHVFTPAGRPLPVRRQHSRVRTPEAVVEQWERIKTREQTEAGARTRVLSGIPRALPALLRAHKIGSRAAAVGFDWPNAGAVLDKIEEEVRELRAAIGEGRARTVEEMGDLFFSLANLARQLRIEPETALSLANDKFTRRFDAVEALLEAGGRNVHEASVDDLEKAWNSVKREPAAPVTSTSVPSSSGRTPRVRRSRR